MVSGCLLHDRLAGSDLGGAVGRPNSPPASRKDSMRRKPATFGVSWRLKIRNSSSRCSNRPVEEAFTRDSGSDV